MTNTQPHKTKPSASLSSTQSTIPTTSNQQQPKVVVPVVHPLSAFGLHAAGYSILDEHYISYISLSQNGQHLLTLTSVDLLAAGYTIATLSPCLIKLAYRDWQTFITCDKPRQSNSTPAKYFQP